MDTEPPAHGGATQEQLVNINICPPHNQCLPGHHTISIALAEAVYLTCQLLSLYAALVVHTTKFGFNMHR